MFFTIRYHPDDKNSEGAERIRNALRQRGFKWDEVVQETDPVWGFKMETVLDVPFYPNYTTPDHAEERLAHIAIVGDECLYDNESAALYNQRYLAREIPVDDE